MKEQSFNTSLVISTYNWPDALRVCLESVARQSVIPDEVIIADDGSTDDTRQVIDAFRAKSSVNIKHVWHEDRGFRKSAILNLALRDIDASSYVIFTDGDQILHRDFVKDHIHLAEPGHYVFGKRAYLSPKATARVLSDGCRIGLLTPGVTQRKNLLRLPWLTPLTVCYRRRRPYGMGCNLAAWQRDLLEVNGYDEDYEGWGYEDTDLICRLRNIGLVSKAAKYQANVIHLWHRQRPANQANLAALSLARENHSKRCANGIRKLRMQANDYLNTQQHFEQR